MTRWKLPAAVSILGACSADSTAPSTHVPVAVTTAPAAAVMAAPSLMLTAPAQLVTLEREGGRTEQARFEAQILVRDTRDATPASDGAILVVSAADAVPLGNGKAWMLRIDIASANVDVDGTIHFRGPAVIIDANDGRSTFDATGSAQQGTTSHPEDLIIDIVGGDAYGAVRFVAQGTVRELLTS